MSVPFSRGTKVKGQTTEYCVEIVVSGRLTQTWLRYSELRELSQALKSVKGNQLIKWGCVFPMIIWREFRMREHRDDHRGDTPHFIFRDECI